MPINEATKPAFNIFIRHTEILTSCAAVQGRMCSTEAQLNSNCRAVWGNPPPAQGKNAVREFETIQQSMKYFKFINLKLSYKTYIIQY